MSHVVIIQLLECKYKYLISYTCSIIQLKGKKLKFYSPLYVNLE